MIADFLKEYERTAGSSYGAVEGGVHYRNLDLILEPLRRHLILPTSKRIKLADFGGGSGIVGLYARNSLESNGIETDLEIVDKNSRQLEGAASEARKYKHYDKVKIILADLLDLGIEEVYHCGVMRMVLNYMTKEQIPVALQNVAEALKRGAIFVNCAMVAFSEEQKIFYNSYRYPSSDRFIFGKPTERYIPTIIELMNLQKSIFGDCFVAYFIKLDQTSRNVQERFYFTKEETAGMVHEWFRAPEKAKKELNLYLDSKGVAHYDWWNVVLTSIKQ